VSVSRVCSLSPRLLLGAGKRGKRERERGVEGEGEGEWERRREGEREGWSLSLSLYIYIYSIERERRLIKEFKEFSLYHVITWGKCTKLNFTWERWQGTIGKISLKLPEFVKISLFLTKI